MDFGDVIKGLLKPEYPIRYQRTGWNGRGMYIYLARAEGFQPFIAMKTAGQQFVPWLASQTDMLATDWKVENDYVG